MEDTTLVNTKFQTMACPFSAAPQRHGLHLHRYGQCDVNANCDGQLCSRRASPEMPSLPNQLFAVLEATSQSTDAEGNEIFPSTGGSNFFKPLQIDAVRAGHVAVHVRAADNGQVQETESTSWTSVFMIALRSR